MRYEGRSTRHGGWKTAAVVLGACHLVLLLLATPAAGQQATDREVAESQRRLEQIRRERAQLRQEMGRIRARVHDISSELANLQRQVAASADLLSELEFQVAQREEQITRNARDLLAAQDALAEREALLHRRLRDIYKRGPLHTADVLLSAKSFSDLLGRYKYLFLVARHDQALLQDVRMLQTQIVGRERALRTSLGELQQVQAERAQEHAQLATLEARQKRALSGARTQERTTARRIEKLAADEKRLSTLVATLERKRREAERRRSTSASGAAEAGSESTLTTRDLGNLSWPVDGRLVYRFGRVTQPNGTVLRWNGVGIGAAAGTRVRAVEEGTVVMAGPFEGYGPTVVLSHGGGYYSLYLYLREVLVKEGDRVGRADAVGTVGGESTPEGPHIEFQIRAPGGQAVDPLAWLQKRGAR